MGEYKDILCKIREEGFAKAHSIYSTEEIGRILNCIDSEVNQDQFAIREFLMGKEHLTSLIFNKKFKALVNKVSPGKSTLIKSLYFNKPPTANWVVNWHQDLTINLKQKVERSPFKFRRTNDKRAVVQPPQKFLESIFTFRIHLDDCSSKNGALRLVPGSHKNGVIDINSWSNNLDKNDFEYCDIKAGGILIMKPLILHSSRRTENTQKRRVIHLEFTSETLPKEPQWKEELDCY